MFKIFKRMRITEWSFILSSICLVILQVYMDLKVPDYMENITRLVKTEGSRMREIWEAGGIMLGCAIISMLLSLMSGFVSARLAAIFSLHLRSDIFHKIQTFSLEEIDRFSTASLITRSTNDVTQLQNFISTGFNLLIRAPITVTIALIKISGKHWQWTALTSCAIVIVLAVVAFIILYAHPKFRRMQALTDDLNSRTRENLTGIRVIRAYNAEAYQEQKFSESNDRLTDNHLRAQRAMNIMHPTMRFINNGLTIGIYCIGSFIIAQSEGTGAAITTFSEMVVFSTYASKILFAFMSLNLIFMQLPRASICAMRINEILDTEPSIHDGTAVNGVSDCKGTVEFRNVSFRYPTADGYTLKNISFTAREGETVAFIGATGSGKTTLVNLIPRFYDTTMGQILINGRDVREYSLKALHNKIGYAPQCAVLFTGTVASNVNYGEDPCPKSSEETIKNIKKAVRIAQAADFVERMDGGYNAVIARGGTNVSGGQKQRLSIARAIYRKPEIYIFDDTFSALDYKTDRMLRAKLKEETAGVTALIVAQRIGTIRDADKIIVLDEGRIIAIGTHQELMQKCDVYKEIAYTQMSKEELA